MKTSSLRILFATVLLTSSVIASATMIDGEVVKPGEHPAVFGLKLDSTETEGACTAFLVAPKLLLTAAHCLKSIESLKLVANGTDLNYGKTQGERLSPIKFGPHPVYTTVYPGMSTSERNRNAANDIGYIALKDPTAITPLPIYMTTNEASMRALYRLEATLVGYGAIKFRGMNADYAGSEKLVKHMGRNTITRIQPGFLWMDGEKNGALPGDSGGPEMAVINGTVKVFGINHGMQGKTVETKRVIKRGPHKGEIEIKTSSNPKEYGFTIGTMLTQSNLCWVIKDSGQKIPGIQCPIAK